MRRRSKLDAHRQEVVIGDYQWLFAKVETSAAAVRLVLQPETATHGKPADCRPRVWRPPAGKVASVAVLLLLRQKELETRVVEVRFGWHSRHCAPYATAGRHVLRQVQTGTWPFLLLLRLLRSAKLCSAVLSVLLLLYRRSRHSEKVV